jgi:hypothetical protein
MRKLRRVQLSLIFYLAIIIVVGLFVYSLKSGFFRAENVQTPLTATINVDANNVTGSLTDQMFGQGVPGDTPIYFNDDYAPALKMMGVKMIRTGNDPFVEPFTKMIGPKENRVLMYGSYFSAGPDEWEKVAKEAGAKLTVIVPYNDGSDKYRYQAKYLVEYMNATVTPEIDQAAVEKIKSIVFLVIIKILILNKI